MSAQEILGSASDLHSLKQIFFIRFTSNYRPKRCSVLMSLGEYQIQSYPLSRGFLSFVLFEAQAS